MIKILAIGDSHIPRRAKIIPEQIITKLEQIVKIEIFDYSFFTGDAVKAPKFMNFLNHITKRDLFSVIGNMDYYGGNQDAPIYRHTKIPLETNSELIIGLTHGHQISPRGDHSQLETLAIKNNFKILISGHTHKEEVKLMAKGILLLNPGSVTGAWSFVASRNPSFIVLNINENTGDLNVTLHRYDIRTANFRDLSSTFIFDNNKIQLKI